MPEDEPLAEPAAPRIGRPRRDVGAMAEGPVASRSAAVAAPVAIVAGGTDGSAPWAVASLIGVNLVPLVGVLGFGWSTLDLMLLYWFENGIIGLFAGLKILLARGPAVRGVAGGADKLFTTLFFAFHYGAFWSVHGFVVVALFGGAGAVGSLASFDHPLGFFFGGIGIAGATLRGGLAFAAMGLLVSHGVSFISNVVLRDVGLDRSPQALMAEPYGRVLVLHVTLVLGAALVLGLGSPTAGLALFVAMKTAVDLAAHLRSHRSRSA